MRAAIVIASALLVSSPFARADEETQQTLSLGKDTVVEFEQTRSKNGRFALGWTIEPSKKGVDPVDWSEYKTKGVEAFDGLDVSGDSVQSRYCFVHGVVDLRTNKFKPLPEEAPYGFCHNHRSIGALWVDEHRAFVWSQDRFWTSDVFFVDPASDPMNVVSLLPAMDAEVQKLIQEIRPLAPDMGIEYNFGPIEDGVLYASFSCCIPKSCEEGFMGEIHISAKDGKVLKVTTDAPPEQPFTGKLGAADKRLNAIYGKLRRKLAGDELKQLVADQKQWILSRNDIAHDAAREESDEEYRKARNAKALELTEQRANELQKRFDAIKVK